MNWIEKVSTNNLFSTADDNQIQKDLFSEYIKIPSIAGFDTNKVSSLAQFFLSISITSGRNNVIHLPIPNIEVYNIAVTELSGHFNDVKATYIGNEPTSLIMGAMKIDSINKILEMQINREINTIVNELFSNLTNLSGSMKPYVKDKSIYKINTDLIENYNQSSSDNDLDIICQCYTNNHLLLYPQSWVLVDELKHSLAIRYFSHRSKNLYLWVDNKTSEVILIHISL